MSWSGESPFFLIFEPSNREGGNVGIDVDASGWIEANRPLFHEPGVWFLMSKDPVQPMLCMPIHDGDQAFFIRHHVGILGSDGAETTVVILGRKNADGTVTRLSLMPNGMVMTGEEQEVDNIAVKLLGG